MIVRNGVEIYPVEVEEIIYMLPEISEAQVFGFLRSEKGQEVAAWIKVKGGQRADLGNSVRTRSGSFTDGENSEVFIKSYPNFP